MGFPVGPGLDSTGDPAFRTETYSFLVHPYIDNSTAQGAKMSKTMPRDVTLASRSIQFLEEVHFDLFGIFTKGLPYLTHTEEKRYRDRLKGLHPKQHK
jgi:hypothetical protein